MASVVVGLVSVLIRVWGLVFGWVYSLYSSPALVRKAYTRVRSAPTRSIREGDTSVTYKPNDLQCPDLIQDFKNGGCETMADAWNWAVARYSDKRLFATRDIIGEEDEIQPNGKLFRKLDLGDYRWMSYDEADSLADNFGRGLRVLGLKPEDNICLFADTKAEWMISAQACFKQSLSVVTLYTNLGEEAVRHGLVETEVETVITSSELLPKFVRILSGQEDKVKRIIYFENPIRRTKTEGFRQGVEFTSYWDVIGLGKKTGNNNMENVEAEPVSPSPETPAIIMYTSGSTGVPKGVVLTHFNLVSTLTSFLYELDAIIPAPDDLYIAYLPLAHVLELIGESMMIMSGVAIGYSGPNTLTDKSTMIKRGGKGDASLLKPTVMFCVPLILDRIYKGVTEQIRRKSSLLQELVNMCIKYKLECINRGEVTPIMDRLIFSSIRALVGGRVRAIMSGGAPLAPDTHDYLKSVLGCPILQGYGLTETSACAAIMRMDENVTGTVGPPVQGVRIQLVNWEEGNYRVTDRPHPRGEILIGGGNVASCYYKLPGKTSEEFFEDEEEKRWFRTGDIGQVDKCGTLQIIDRKKDLVKLQFGEYVSLGKVESVLKGCPVIQDICIYGDSTKSYVVSLVVPARPALSDIAQKFGKSKLTFEQLCEDKDITGAVLREIINQGKQSKLEKFEIPGAVSLCREEWTPESGLTTAAMKLKRRPLQDFYQADINRMYGQGQ